MKAMIDGHEVIVHNFYTRLDGEVMCDIEMDGIFFLTSAKNIDLV